MDRSYKWCEELRGERLIKAVHVFCIINIVPLSIGCVHVKDLYKSGIFGGGIAGKTCFSLSTRIICCPELFSNILVLTVALSYRFVTYTYVY